MLTKNEFEPKMEENEIVYLISTKWLKHLYHFLKKNNNPDDLRHFDRKQVALLYFNDGILKEQYKRLLGYHPGPINNLGIVKLCDSWEDQLDSISNIFIEETMREQVDFIYVNREFYLKVSQIFEENFSVQRQVINFEENKLIEVFLKKFKILVFSENLNKNEIRPKLILISKTLRLNDLKEKIFRCINLDSAALNTQISIKFYIIESENLKKDLFQSIHAYTNNFSTYKIKGKELNDPNLLLNDLNINSEDLIIVDILTETDKRKKFFIQLDNSKEEKCSLCENIIETKIQCDECKQFIYCSNDCKQFDDAHKNYHKHLNELYKKKMELNEILNINVNELLNRNSRRGLCGLKNLGNTCFMNSAVQCLSHSIELTKYFLIGKFKEEINRNNKYGSGGQIAKAYYELVKELWIGESNWLSPWDFRQIFVGFVKQFAGFSQHDSHEMLTFMLDALHEDLNRVKSKPYVELSEKETDENEEEAANRWWKSHILRENSIITDLFHGQHRSEIVCPDCNRVSITYDPFCFLGLPIPVGPTSATVKYFSFDAKTIKIAKVPLSSTTNLTDIKNYLSKEFNVSTSKIYSLIVKGLNFKKIMTERISVQHLYENGYEVICYELDSNISENDLILFSQPVINDGDDILFYPKPIKFNSKTKIEEVYFELFKQYYPYYNNNNHNNQNLDNFAFRNQYESLNELPFNVLIYNNIREYSPDNKYSGYEICEYCKKNCFACEFKFQRNETIDTVYEVQRIKRPILLFLNIKEKYFNANSSLIPGFNPLVPGNSNNFSSGKNISLYDCLDAFRSPEILEKDNEWYCSNCKSHKQATKKMDILKPPHILIIQLKRFKIKTNNVMLGMIHNKKNETLIDFPVKDLNLSEYVVSANYKENALYDLYAISQHFGSLNSGHYTALCESNGAWFEFDDNAVRQSSKNACVTSSAYLLFYRRK